MKNFSLVRNVVCHLGSRSQVGLKTAELRCKSVVVVGSPGFWKRESHEMVVESIRDKEITADVFDKVTADTPEHVVLELIQFVKDKKADGVVGVGGGSSMDAAKLAAFMCGDTTQSLEDIYDTGDGKDKCIGRRLSLVQVPTTAGTGSEVTNISVVTTGVPPSGGEEDERKRGGKKKGVVSQKLYADCAILDGDLTTTVPSHITAYTGIDAMVHAIEAFTSKNKKNVLSDALAREALRLLGANIRRACADGNDKEAREAMLLGSFYAGVAFTNSPCAAVHALAYPLGSPRFEQPHGLANSLMLPHVLRFTGENPAAAAMYKELTPIIFPEIVEIKGTGVFALAEGFSRLAEDLGIPTSLKQVKIKEGDVERLAKEAFEVKRLLDNNMRKVTLEDARDLYTSALNN